MPSTTTALITPNKGLLQTGKVKMGVLIDNRQNSYRISKKRIRKSAQAILNALANPEAELSILIVDDIEITDLNEKYFNRQGSTNVISFPMLEGEFAEISPLLLGDVVISMDTTRREATHSGISPEERFDQLLVHGILHLFGYDHEHDATEARRMEEKSTELLELIKNI